MITRKQAAGSLVLASLHHRFQSHGREASLGLLLVLALSGCASVQVGLGRKIYLEKMTVTSIAASLPKGPEIAPGEKSPMVVTFTAPDGSILQTEGEGHGKVLWKDLKVVATVANADQKGNVTLPQDPRLSEGKLPHVIITVPSHPDLRAEFDIPVRYDHKFSSYFAGTDGSSGSNGFNGTSGSSGSFGSLDPDHPVAGGDGSDGTDGSDGGRGSDGDDGPPLQVRVALRPGSQPLLQVSVSARGHETLFLVDPQGGSLTVSSVGGSGGSGGKGGQGGSGGSGGIGSPNGRSGRNGSDGHDGSNGSDGRGGRITVTYDPQAKPYLSAIRLTSPGGPRTVFKEEPVAALW